MDVITLEAKARECGRKSNRAARLAEQVPCVLYGHKVEAQAFQIPELDLRPLIYTDEFRRVQVSLGKESYECILKNVDFHPTTDRPIHADFQVLVAGEKITLNVPIHYTGDSIGVLDGGKAEIFVHEVSIRCLPKDIPEHIHVDIANMDIGDSVIVRDLDFEGLTFNVPEDQTLISVIRPREIIEEEEELEEGLEEGEEGAEGDAESGGGEASEES